MCSSDLAGCGGGTKGSAPLTAGPTASPSSTTLPEVLDSTAMAAAQQRWVMKVYTRAQTGDPIENPGLIVVNPPTSGSDVPPGFQIPPFPMVAPATPTVMLDKDGLVVILHESGTSQEPPSFLQTKPSKAQIDDLLAHAERLGLLGDPGDYGSGTLPTPSQEAEPLAHNAVEFTIDGKTYRHRAPGLGRAAVETSPQRRALAEFLELFEKLPNIADWPAAQPFTPETWSIKAIPLDLSAVPEARRHGFAWLQFGGPPLANAHGWVDIPGDRLTAALEQFYATVPKPKDLGASMPTMYDDTGVYFFEDVDFNATGQTDAAFAPYGLQIAPFPAEYTRYGFLSPEEDWFVTLLPRIFDWPA